MTLPTGFDFRATAGFVTDPTNCFSNVGPPGGGSGTTNGVAWTWTDSLGALNVRDRSSTLATNRLAGCAFSANLAPVVTLAFTLPSAGTYILNYAFGDQASAQNQWFNIYDGTTSGTLLKSVAGTATTAAQWLDAQDVVANDTTWNANNPTTGGGTGGKSYPFSTTTLTIEISGIAAQTGTTVLSHFMISQSGGGGGGDILLGAICL